MLTKRMVGALALLPALVQVSSGPVSRLTTTRMSVRQHAPLRFHGMRADGTMESENWSGYAVTGASFTQALGSWIVPTVNCTSTPNTYSSFWVGLDGYSSSTVEQTGTDSDCYGTSPSYYAWYEFYPQGSYLINLAISPGNKISAEVNYSGSSFTVTITNVTTGKSFSKTSTVSGAKRSSAEWIAEAPCCTRSGGILPLSDFGTVDFGDSYTGVANTNYATETSTSGSMSAFGSALQEIIMVSSKGAEEALPSALSGGTGFTVGWKSE